jgi:hypothetical protein
VRRAAKEYTPEDEFAFREQPTVSTNPGLKRLSGEPIAAFFSSLSMRGVAWQFQSSLAVLA